jgi:hypothetical protein
MVSIKIRAAIQCPNPKCSIPILARHHGLSQKDHHPTCREYGCYGTVPSAGSCIFIHVWRARDKGTAGCIAMPESRVTASQDFAEHGGIIAILPESALTRFKECLPDVAQMN